MSRKILIVDDSATMRQQTRTLLQGAGFTILEAGNGQEGLTQAEGTACDLIIADVNMPVMNGIDMIGHIRKLPTYAKIPIFVLTTESSGDAVQRGKAAGATAWVVKPFKPETLLGAVKKVLA